MKFLKDQLFKVFADFFDTRPAFHFRDKTGAYEFMEMEITEDPVGPAPFPCITVKVWPNGKGDNTPPTGTSP